MQDLLSQVQNQNNPDELLRMGTLIMKKAYTERAETLMNEITECRQDNHKKDSEIEHLYREIENLKIQIHHREERAQTIQQNNQELSKDKSNLHDKILKLSATKLRLEKFKRLIISSIETDDVEGEEFKSAVASGKVGAAVTRANNREAMLEKKLLEQSKKLQEQEEQLKKSQSATNKTNAKNDNDRDMQEADLESPTSDMSKVDTLLNDIDKNLEAAPQE